MSDVVLVAMRLEAVKEMAGDKEMLETVKFTAAYQRVYGKAK